LVISLINWIYKFLPLDTTLLNPPPPHFIDKITLPFEMLIYDLHCNISCYTNVIIYTTVFFTSRYLIVNFTPTMHKHHKIQHGKFISFLKIQNLFYTNSVFTSGFTYVYEDERTLNCFQQYRRSRWVRYENRTIDSDELGYIHQHRMKAGSIMSHLEHQHRTWNHQ
jgi:hypothetical protein